MQYGKPIRLYSTFLLRRCVYVRALVRSRRTTLQQNRRCYHCLLHRHHRSSTFRARDTLFSIPSAFSPLLLLFSFFYRCRPCLPFHNVCWNAIKLENMLLHSSILSNGNVRSVVFLELIFLLSVVAIPIC